MRVIPNEMAARIESGAATLCHVWRLTRADGTVMGFTDHDRDLTVAGVVCRAASGWTAGAMEAAVGPQAGSAAVEGGLDDDGLTEADIAAGLYDGAEVELWRVDWRRPDLKVRLWRGSVARVRRDGQRFTAELEGPAAALERVVGRTYGRLCDAVLLAFRQATALGDGVWRLSGLLRALQGTEREMGTRADAGATVVVLDESLTRLDFGRDERGLPLLFRAAPAGAPPGGAGATSQTVVCLGVHDRPWSPVHLRWRSEGGDMIIGWLPRRRLFGDGWDADRSLETGLRFRLRILDGAIERRTIEVEGLQAVYPQAAQMSDFPGGLAAASVEVSQWGEGWGWGPAARLSLAV